MSELNQANENTETQAAAPAPKLSRREKLLEKYNAAFAKQAELVTTLAELANEITSIDLLASITVGHAVIISIGKGESAKDVEAVVIGVKDAEDGSKQYKVQYGTGFDADIAVVSGNKLKLPPQVAAAETVAAE